MASHQDLLTTVIYEDQDYIDYVKSAYDEWEQGGRKGNPPQFFTGSMESKLAVISLNPHSGDAQQNSEIDYNKAMEKHGRKWSWDVYYQFYSNFCQERYGDGGIASDQIDGLSRFDRELHCFFSGNNNPTKQDLAGWKIFHVEISYKETPNYRPQQAEKENNCRSLLRSLEAISLRERSMIILLNGYGCSLIDSRKFQRELNFSVQRDDHGDLRYRIIPRKGELTGFAQRRDYSIRLPNGRCTKLVATPTFPLKQVGNRFDFTERYYHNAFTDVEKDKLAQGLGIPHKTEKIV